MNKIILTLAIILITSISFSQTKPYVIYNSKGKKISYKKMLRKIAKNDIVLFGELHNNPIAHWLQYEVTLGLTKSRQLILGAEMFEADNQNSLNNYLNGSITKKGLDTLARLWPNYKTDYAPLVNLAKNKKLAFVATNIPRRFANKVYKKGFKALDLLSTEEKTWLAPLPIHYNPNLPTYKEILVMMGDHGTPELVMSQASKDATMAYFILKNYKKGNLFMHYNGAYHSDKYEGILYYLKRSNNSLKYATISTVQQENVNKLEKKNRGKADFIISVDKNMTKTY